MQVFSVKKSNHDFRIREAYRVLRTNIEFSGNDNKVILITSSTPSEGRVQFLLNWQCHLHRMEEKLF